MGAPYTVERVIFLKSPESFCLPLFNVLEKFNLRNRPKVLGGRALS
jgi:hypothetical protein